MGALLAFALGPFFPNLGIAHVVALGVLVIAYGTFFRVRGDRASSRQERATLAVASFCADAAIVAYAMLVFSPDPRWTTFILGSLVIIIGAFRFGTIAAVISTGAMSLAYVAVAIFRDQAFGLAFEADRAAFHVGFFILTGLLAGGILRELYALRGEREDTARRVADAGEARRSEERLRAVLDSALDAVIGMGPDGRVMEWNPQAAALFGWSREEMIGVPLVDRIIPERYRDAHLAGLGRYLATGIGPVIGKRVELEAVRRDGSEVPVELSIVAIKDDVRTTFSAFVRDLSERRRLDAIARRDIEREQAQQARSALLAKMSHELRTPLNAILGFTELIEEQVAPGLSERHRRYLENIRTSGHHLLKLVDELLGLTKAERDRDADA